jgi:hypothetical protein
LRLELVDAPLLLGDRGVCALRLLFTTRLAPIAITVASAAIAAPTTVLVALAFGPLRARRLAFVGE